MTVSFMVSWFMLLAQLENISVTQLFGVTGNAQVDILLNMLGVIFISFLILVIGYVFAVVIELVLTKMFKRAKIEDLVAEHGLSGALMGFTLSGIITTIVKWTIFLTFLAWSVNWMEIKLTPGGAPVLSGAIRDFVDFLPALLKGLLIIVTGFMLGDFIAAKAREGIKFHGKSAGLLVKMVIVYFTVVIVLSIPEYNLNTELLANVFEFLALGVALGVAGAITLAFGLGMKDSIGRIMKKQERSLEHLLFGVED